PQSRERRRESEICACPKQLESFVKSFGASMSMVSQMRRSEVGEVRPSQTLTTYGVGSLVDLPNLSVLVMGLDDWPASHSTEIAEERLMLSAQSILGPQVSRFLTPPRGPDSVGAQTIWFDESRQIGVPVAPFP